jgi:DNA-binding NarL/FixJ family response regulator
VSLRVLIADDHRGFRELLQLMLSQRDDVEVVGAAADGEQAVRLAEDLQPDVVLMDITMPALDGFEATRRIRGRQPDVTVLMLSGSAAARDVEEARAAGAAGYLTKSRISEIPEALAALAA